MCSPSQGYYQESKTLNRIYVEFENGGIATNDPKAIKCLNIVSVQAGLLKFHLNPSAKQWHWGIINLFGDLKEIEPDDYVCIPALKLNEQYYQLTVLDPLALIYYVNQLKNLAMIKMEIESLERKAQDIYDIKNSLWPSWTNHK